MTSVLFVLAAVCLFASLAFALLALFARDAGADWTRVAGALVSSPVRGVVAGEGVPAPVSGRPAAWFAAWVVETGTRAGGEPTGASIASFERSTAPLVVASGGRRITIPADGAWVQDGPDEIPFGAANAHRALAAWPGTRSIEAWERRTPPAERDSWQTFEVLLEPGAEVEVHDRDGTVMLLRARSPVAREALARAVAARGRRRRRTRAALVLAAAFVVLAVLAGATA